MNAYLLVFLGGGLGSITRFSLSRVLEPYGFDFPYSTLLANVLSCFILGMLTGLNLKDAVPPSYRLLIATGFCGGFSTFSTFSNETLQLLQNGNALPAFLNIGGSLFLCFLAVWVGMRVF